MMDCFNWLEQTGFSQWVRESGSIWSYPLILTLHTCGMGILVGFSWAVDLRMLGVAPSIPVTAMERFFRVMWIGFAINTTTGIILLMADATTKMTSWVFGIKMIFITLAMIVVLKIRKRVCEAPGEEQKPYWHMDKSLAGLRGISIYLMDFGYRWLVVMLISLFPLLLEARSVSGTVKDASGVPVAGVKLTITNKIQGVKTVTASNSKGAYGFLTLRPGFTIFMRKL